MKHSNERAEAPLAGRCLSVVGLFAGIGGFELGLQRAGHSCSFLCEIDDSAREILRARFSNTNIVRDIRDLETLGEIDLVTAGFPCQDLSQAGRTNGIDGPQSSLVKEVFRLLEQAETKPLWVLLENVPFMLHLDRGKAMRFIITALERLNYQWAYRIVDTRAFGLPQRRHRVFLLASRTEDPRTVLLVDDAGELGRSDSAVKANGFYWTEGNGGLGWAIDAVPPLKGGPTIRIPCPPAIWQTEEHAIVTPDIRDAERLQGFPEDWTLPPVPITNMHQGIRWRLVGNAVSVPVARWIGERLRAPGIYPDVHDDLIQASEPLPKAAWGKCGSVYRAKVSTLPLRLEYEHLGDFLRHQPIPLSERATAGFLRRATASSLRFAPDFLTDVAAHLELMQRKSRIGKECPVKSVEV